MALIKFSTPPTLAGFFFCLASAEGAGLLFLPGGVSTAHKRLQRLFCRPCHQITAITPKPFTGLYRRISIDLTHSSARNTAATQAAYIPIEPRWRAYRQAQHLPPIPDTADTPDAVQGRAAAYYNNVYRGAPCYGSMPGEAA